jgi:hypothetical protein
MEARIRIGPRRSFALSHALLIYRDNSAAFVTLHEVQGEKNQAPYLGPGQPLTTSFLRTLARGLGSRITPEILPGNVLVRTPDSIVWWSTASRHVMFFSGGTEEAARLNGRVYPQRTAPSSRTSPGGGVWGDGQCNRSRSSLFAPCDARCRPPWWSSCHTDGRRHHFAHQLCPPTVQPFRNGVA